LREVLKGGMNKSLKKTKKRNKQLKEMNKTIQDLKTEVEAIKKTQTKRVLEMKN
jgi:uncharacterized protein YoxC